MEIGPFRLYLCGKPDHLSHEQTKLVKSRVRGYCGSNLTRYIDPTGPIWQNPNNTVNLIKNIDMKKIFITIVLLISFGRLVSQDLNGVSILKTEATKIFSDIHSLLVPVTENFNDDYVIALYCMEEDSTIFGMAMGDFETVPKFYQLKYKDSKIETIPREVKNTKQSIFGDMRKKYIPTLKKNIVNSLNGLNVYISPVLMKRWGYITYYNKANSERYQDNTANRFACLRFGSIEQSTKRDGKNDRDWLDSLFVFCLGLSCSYYYY